MLRDVHQRSVFLRHLHAWAISDPYRNLLSAAGLVIGVAGIVVALALVIGESRQFLGQLRLVGFRTVYVSAREGPLPRTSPVGIMRSLPRASHVTEVSLVYLPILADTGQRLRSAPVMGVDSTYFKILSDVPIQGRALSEADVRLGNSVCVVGRGLYDQLGRPQTVTAGSLTLRVAGVLEAPMGEGGDTGLKAADPGGAVLVPSSLGYFGGRDKVQHQLLVQVQSDRDVESAKERLIQYFKRRMVAEIEVASSEELLRRYRSTRSHLSLVVGAVAFLALILGGLGILNNMLSVILERLPEIGIRISMGATKIDIVLQFVAETLVVTVLGAIAGMVIGLPSIALISAFDLAPVAVPWWLPVLPPIIGVMIGLLCGGFPAARAAGYNPIETLTFR